MSAQPNLPSDNPLPQRGRRRPLLFVLLVLVLLFVITYAGRLNEYRRLLNQEISMQDQVDDAEARGRQLVKELDYVKSREYTEKVAITELGLAREGDQVLTVIDAQAAVEVEQALDAAADTVVDAAGVIAQDLPATDAEPSVWRQWLSVFRSQGE
jgi:hypothetical protein